MFKQYGGVINLIWTVWVGSHFRGEEFLVWYFGSAYVVRNVWCGILVLLNNYSKKHGLHTLFPDGVFVVREKLSVILVRFIYRRN